ESCRAASAIQSAALCPYAPVPHRPSTSCLPRPFPEVALPVFLLQAQSLQAFPFCSLKQAAAGATVGFEFYRLVQRARLPKIVPKQTSSIAQSEALLQIGTPILTK